MITFCTKCGNKNLNGAAKFCSKCGASFNTDTSKNLDLLNKNISEISETLFIVPQYFINDFEILLKKYDVRPKGILAINNPNESYLIVTQFMRNTKNVSYICIIGSWAEIPPYKIPNPTDSDQDKFCFNDSLYGSISENKNDVFASIPDVLVGRVPYTKSSIVEKIIFNKHSLKSFTDSFLFSVTAQCWDEASKKIFSNLIEEKPKDYNLSSQNDSLSNLSKGGFFNSPQWTEIDLKNFLGQRIKIENAFIMFNVHGGADTPEWIGEGVTKNYVEIFKPNTIVDYNFSILLTEACYGGAMDYQEQSIVESFFENNGLCFIGSSTIAYGSPTEQICAADNIAKYFFENVNNGDCVGLALSKAKLEVLQESPIQSDISSKTAFSFNLYGPPWIKKETISSSEGILNRLRNTKRNKLKSNSIFLSDIREKYREKIPKKIRQFLIDNDKIIDQLHQFRDYNQINLIVEKYGFNLSKSKIKYIENSQSKGYEIKLSEKYYKNTDKNLLIFTDIDGNVLNVLISK